MLLNEYEIEFMFRKIRNIRNLGNVHIRGPHIVMSRTDAQNGLDFHFKKNFLVLIKFLILRKSALENVSLYS
jgi:hypothetical protein